MNGFRIVTRKRKGLMALGLALCLCGCATVPTAPPGAVADQNTVNPGLPEALAFFSMGLLHETNFEYESAVSAYEQAIEVRPDDPEAYFRIARIRLLQTRTDEAVQQLRAYAKRHPDSARTWISLALIHRAAKEYTLTLSCFEQAIKAEPQSRAAYLESARLLIELNRIPEALEVLRKGARNTTQPSNCRISLVDTLVLQSGREKDPAAQEKLLEEAVRVLKKELENRPDAADIFYRLGDICIRLDRWEEAVREYEALFAQAPDNLRIHRRLAASFTRDASEKEAIDRLLALYQANPDLVRIPYYVGELLQLDERPQEAIPYYRMACENFPDEGGPVIRLASLELVDQPEVALGLLRTQLERLPDNLPLRETYARALLALDQFEEACTEFERTAALVEKDSMATAEPEFYLRHAMACIRAGQTNDLDRLLSASLGNDPALTEPYIEFVLQQGDEPLLNLAAAQLLELADREPGTVVFNLFRGLLHNALQQHEQAREAFRQAEREALELGPSGKAYLTPSYYFWYGAACERSEHIEEAEQKFLAAIRLEPKYADAHNYLAYMWADRNLNLDRALEHIQQALELEPENAAFLDTLGWVYYHQGRYAEALEKLAKAVELLPDDPTLLEHLGDAYAKVGQPDSARINWEKALALSPEQASLKLKLAPPDAPETPTISEPLPEPEGEEYPVSEPEEALPADVPLS